MSFRLSQRDKGIIGFINQFRAVDRDSLVELFFKQLKSPVNACNSVMVRLYSSTVNRTHTTAFSDRLFTCRCKDQKELSKDITFPFHSRYI